MTVAKKSPAAGKTLVVVESPAKAKTIEKYLGRSYAVRASMGHLRDLPKSQFGIDIEQDFEPHYINIRGKGDIIRELKKDAQAAAKVYLASDPDREGEAIAWHLAHLLDIDANSPCRIVFNEITKPAIQAAVKSPQPINIDRVDAQQSRRLLDRIVGYKLSPLLWRKVRKGLSAGRVQSVTVKLICDRERLIESFVSQEYWSIELKLRHDKSAMFDAALVSVKGRRLDEKKDKEWRPLIADEKTALAIAADLRQQQLVVNEVKKSTVTRKAPPPFNTSSLQQDAARKLNFTSRKTMLVAQQLYEGIALGSGPVGLITYMRTDSVRLSDQAVGTARDYIRAAFGKEFVPARPNVYVTGKNAQDAHEAIRPTDITRTPASVEKYLNADQYRLYNLIWQRFTACQMKAAEYDRLSVSITAGADYLCRASGSVLKFPGFTAVYAGIEGKKEKDIKLPPLEAGDIMTLVKISPEQHFTEPPPRYNEASLVKELEEKGIGRPSTYSPIIETILARGYVIRADKHFQPTELGKVVVEMLEEYFPNIVDVSFTAGMEGELDEVAEGKISRVGLLKEFYAPFAETLEKADAAIGHVEMPVEVTDVKCELCGRYMVIRQGRYGKFMACPGFPECRNTKPIVKKTGAGCPKCGGNILERKSRRGRIFYGCENYPDCDYVSWDIPLTEPCPKCGALQLKHRYKNGRTITYCYNDACETRVNHPINRELERAAVKAAKAEEKAVAVKTTKATKTAKATKPKTAAKTAAKKKTTAKK